MKEEIEKISSVTEGAKVAAGGTPTPSIERLAPNRDHFESLMNQGQGSTSPSTLSQSSAIDKPSPMEVVSQNNSKLSTQTIESQSVLTNTVSQTPTVEKPSIVEEMAKLNSRMENFSKATPESIKAQAQSVIGQIESLKSQLANPSQEFRSSLSSVLKNKLSHIDDNLRIALSKAGVEYATPPQLQGTTNPLERFIGYLTHGQYQLENLSQTIDNLNLKDGQVSQAKMLSLQMRLGFVQQEIEFFTSVLNNALQSVKTIMNVQV